MHGIQNFFGPNDFIGRPKKVPFCDFIQNVSQAPSMYLVKDENVFVHFTGKNAKQGPILYMKSKASNYI